MKKKGFTIIEVLLVLAIGGLILVMALIALPGISRTERDARRKSDLQVFASRLKEFQTNSNRGSLPSSPSPTDNPQSISRAGASDSSTDSWGVFFRDYFDENFKDPNGDQYKLYVLKCKQGTNPVPNSACQNTNTSFKNLNDNSKNMDYYFYVVVNATCGDGNKAVYSANARKAAVLYKLETKDVACESI